MKIFSSKYGTDEELFQYQNRIVELFSISEELTQKNKNIFKNENKMFLEENQIISELNLLTQVHTQFKIATTEQRYSTLGELLLKYIFQK